MATGVLILIVIVLSALFFISFAYFILKNVRRNSVYSNNSGGIEETLKKIVRQNEEIIELLKKK